MTEEWITVKYRVGTMQEAWAWIDNNFTEGDYFRVKWSYVVQFKHEEDAILFALKWS